MSSRVTAQPGHCKNFTPTPDYHREMLFFSFKVTAKTPTGKKGKKKLPPALEVASNSTVSFMPR